MSKITLDAELKAKLNGLNEPLEICDEAGKTVGHFLPDSVYRKFVMAWLNSQLSDEELNRLDQQEGGSTLAQIWKRLGHK